MYKELIQKDIDVLEREESNIIKKHNILKNFRKHRCNIYWYLFALWRGT